MIGIIKRHKLKDVLLIVGVILTVLGPIMLLACGIGVACERHFLKLATSAEAMVVVMAEVHHDDGTSYAPVYVFLDTKGQEQKIFSKTSSYPPAYRVGDKIKVVFDPLSPRDAQMDNYFDMWGWQTLVGGIGVAQVMIGIVLILVTRKLKEK